MRVGKVPIVKKMPELLPPGNTDSRKLSPGLSGIGALCRYYFRCVQCAVERMCTFDDVLSLGHFSGGTVGDHQELIRLERCFVLHNAVFRNSNAVETRAESAQCPHFYGTF